jgi:hypothetical protein
MFDLSKSTANWLGDLKQSGAFEDSDLEELESHLNDEIEQLMDHGLSPKEAFWVATSRVGNREQLPDEYAKTNSRAVWRHRFLWMAVGVLAYLVLNYLIWLLSYGGTLVTVSSGIGSYPATVLSLSVQILVACVALASAYFILSRDKFGISNRYRRARESGTRIIVFYAIPVALLGILASLWCGAGPTLLPLLADSEKLSTTWEATYWGSQVFSFLFAVVLACLAFLLSRPRKSKVDLGLER